MSTVVTASPRKRVPRTFRAVAVGSVALVLLLGAVAATLYVKFIRYERVAARHVPIGAVLAARLDVEQAPLYEPVRHYVLPLLGGPNAAATVGDATLVRIEKKSGLHRGDLREIVVARGKEHADWVVVLGGIFSPKGGASLAEALRSEAPEWESMRDGRGAVHSGLGIAVGRADDGAVLIASSEQVFAAALEQNPTFEVLRLRRTGAGSLAIGKRGIQELAEWPTVLGMGALPSRLSDLDGITAELLLDDRMNVRVLVSDSGSGSARRVLEQTVARVQATARPDSPADRIVKAGVDRAKPPTFGSNTSEIQLVWDREEADQAFSLLAEAIRRGWH